MPSPFKKSQKNKEDIDQSLREIIYKKVTKKTHNYGSPKKGDGTIKKCIELFNKGASPEVLTQLEESLRGQEEYHGYYIKNFLPELKDEVIKSEELAAPPVFNNEIEQSQRPQTVRGKIVRIISEITKKSSNKDHPSSTIQGQNGRRNSQIDRQDNTNTPELSSGSDSGIDSPRTSEESSRSPVSSRKSSVSSILSSAGENNNLQKENENQVQPEQAAPEEPKIQENENSDGQANPDQVKKDILLKNQPNNRNFHVVLVAGCALSTIGCIVAGVMTSGLVGAGLLAMAAVFAIAAVAELHSNFLSSKLTSISVEPHVNDKELTACSHL